MKAHTFAILLAGSASLAAIPTTPAKAQAVNTAASDPQGDEIIVTARKREERLQTVPAAITAYTGEQLVQQSITKVTDLQYITPGLQLRTTASASAGATVAIRGQVQNDTTLALDQSVGTYVDDVYIARDIGNALDLLDVQSVQVLKGPQGTLFGRNTTGGAIVITRNKPGPDFGGYVNVGAGNHGSFMVEGAINVPLSSTLFARVAVQGKDDHGYGRGVNSGDRFEVHKNRTVVGSLRWQPTDDVQFTLVGDARDSDGTSPGLRLLTVDPNGAGNFLTNGALLDAFNAQKQIGNKHSSTNNLEPVERAKSGGVSLTSEFELGDVSLKSVSAWRTLELHSTLDLDASDVEVAEVRYNITGYDQFTQEVTLNGSIGSRLDWTAGGFYFHEKGRETDPFKGLIGTAAEFLIVQDAIVTSQSLAGYVFLNYKVTDKFRLAGGIRYSEDKKTLDQRSTTNGGVCYLANTAGGTPLSPCQRTTKATFDGISYTVSADYQANANTLLYLTHRKGLRSGGINFRGSLPEEVIPYKPEVVYDFEGGLKSDLHLGDMPVRFNVAAFYDIYNSVQRTITIPGPNGGVVTNVINAATASVYGGEIEINARPTTSLDVHVGLAAAIARYKKFEIAGVDVSNSRFFTPDFSGDVSVRYHLPFASDLNLKDMVLGGRYYFQTKSALSTINNPVNNQAGYSLVSARLDLIGVAGSNVDLSAFVDNIFNKNYLANSIDFSGSLGWVTGSYGAPRTWGIRGSVKF